MLLVTRMVVVHRDGRLRVSVGYRDLGRRPLFEVHLARIRTPTGSFEAVTERLGGAPIVTLSTGPRSIMCPGLRAMADPQREKVVLSVPTECLGAPRWVQVGVAADSAERDPVTPGSAPGHVFLDDGHRDGAVYEERIAVGPKVRRD